MRQHPPTLTIVKGSISVIIYTSEKVMPYVYMGIHKITGEFYIGSRGNKTTQKLPSHLDLYQYRTSSKKVKPRFDEFDWHIVAEFFDAKDAYTFEQQLIFDHWDNRLRLNDRHNHGRGAWSVAGHIASDITKQKQSYARRNTAVALMPDGTKKRVSLSDPRWATGEIVGMRKGAQYSKQSHEHKTKKADAIRGSKRSQLTKDSMSATRKGKVAAYDSDGNGLGLIDTNDPRWGHSIFKRKRV